MAVISALDRLQRRLSAVFCDEDELLFKQQKEKVVNMILCDIDKIVDLENYIGMLKKIY